MSIDNVKRYGWDEYDASKEGGKVSVVPVEELHIDRTYQRNIINQRTVNNIARHFNARDLDPLVVGIRDGMMYVIDGQHRLLAAKKRGIEFLPCRMSATTLEEEARSFLRINGSRAKVSAYQRFKAAVICKDEPDLEIDGWIRRNGFRIKEDSGHNRSNEISFIHNLRKKWIINSLAAKTALVLMHAIAEDNERLESETFKGFWYLLNRGIDVTSHKDKLIKEGGLNAINRSIVFVKNEAGQRESEKCAAVGILRVMNRKKKKKIRLDAEDI